MNTSPSTVAKDRNFFQRGCLFFEKETGQSLKLWAVFALLNFVMQVIFHRELASTPGEFSALNTILGFIGMMLTPLLALQLAFASYPLLLHPPGQKEYAETLQGTIPRVTQIVAMIWGGISILLVPVLLSLLSLQRFSLSIFTFLLVLIALGSLTGEALCRNEAPRRLWRRLLVAAVLVRLILGAGLAWEEPVAEMALTAFLFAGLITLTPVLRQKKAELATSQEWRTVMNRDFLIYLGATFSVVLALFLFSSADRIIAQSWFGRADNNNIGYIVWSACDDYQTAGLLGRALLWGTQPLLVVLFVHRSRLDRTTPGSLKFFWIYLVALWGGAILLTFLRWPLSWLFCGTNFQGTAQLIPAFALAMALLGVIQGLGVFALASRRYPECFVLGGCGIVYALTLYLTGRQPVLMLTYMFGAGLVALLLLLFVGIVRWGRKQP